MLPHAPGRTTTRPRTAPDGRRTEVRARPGTPLGAPVAALAAVLVGLGLTLLGAGPAAAHNTLVSSDPADGSTAATAPAQVTLTFNEPAVALGTVVEVRAPDGRVVSSGDAVLTDASVAQALSGELPAGDYAVLWRVTSADGHPIEGQLTFTAQGATTIGDVPAAAGPAVTPTAAAPTPTETPTPTPTSTAPEATESAEPAERDPEAEASATNALLAGTVAALVALGVVVAVLIRRRPHGQHGGAGASAAAAAPRDGQPGGSAGGTGGAGGTGPDGSAGTRDGATGD
jgi:methionine-rich copper-binding protein CopC